jgi:hypothetical protein
MTKEQEAEVIQFVQIQIQQAIARANVVGIAQDMYLSPDQKRIQIEEVFRGMDMAIEKIKSNGTAI